MATRSRDPESLAVALARLYTPGRPPAREGRAVRFFREIIYGYFDGHGRDFPWRRTDDPYHILVSEIMLQQTQTARVAERFPAFIGAFPRVDDLADAALERVVAEWRGLGYNRRALNLHRAARAIVDVHAGVVPRDPELLGRLPGIGAATARSIAAFAYDEPTVFIETNIRAVYLFFFFPGSEGVPDAEILPCAAAALDRARPRRWYSALMDYGAMLKKSYANPSRRGAGHRPQPAFEGSMRQLRGLVLGALVESGPLEARDLAGMTGRGIREVRDAAAGLVRDGLVAEESGRYRISR